MTENGASFGGRKPMPSALRFVGAFLTIALILGLTFFMIVVDTRDRETSLRRDVAYGELKRIESALRDISDVSRQKACAEVVEIPVEIPAENSDAQIAEVLSDESTDATRRSIGEEDPGDGEGGNDQDSGKGQPDAQKKCVLKSVRLTFEGAQGRDWRTVLETRAIPPTAGSKKSDTDGVAQFFEVDERINGSGDNKVVTDVAIVTGDWDIALSLRGDAAWPANLSAILRAGEPIGWNLGKAVVEEREEERREGRKTKIREEIALGGPITINIGGERVVAQAIPLNIRRTVLVGKTGLGSQGRKCAPRECLLIGISRDEDLISDIGRLSPLTRASFVAAIVLLLLLVPLSKLWLIHPRSSMSWADVSAIIASIPLAIATTFVISLVWAEWIELQHSFDEDARSLAIELARDADNEILQTGRALSDLYQSNLPTEDLRQKQIDKGIDNVFAVNETGSLLYLFDGETKDATFNYKTRQAPVNGVRSRRYFRRAKEGQFLRATNGPMDYVVALVPSLVEGNSTLVTMLRATDMHPSKKWRLESEHEPSENSAPTPAPASDSARAATYVFGNHRPFFSQSVPLPAEYSFAVLDPETLEVLQHSDEGRAGAERWSDRVDDVAALREMLEETMRQCDLADAEEGRAIQSQTLRYAGTPVHLTAAPSCAGQWAVMVWYPAEMTQKMAIIPAALSVGLILLIGLVTAVLAVAIGITSKRRLVKIFWPDLHPIGAARTKEKWSAPVQLDTIVVATILLLVSLCQVFLLRGDAAFWHIFAVLSASLAVQFDLADTKVSSVPRTSSKGEASAISDTDPDASADQNTRNALKYLTFVAWGFYGGFCLLVLRSYGWAPLLNTIFFVVLSIIGLLLLAALRWNEVFDRLFFLPRLSAFLKSWLARDYGIKSAILRQSLTQALIVALVAVLPSILAYRAASAVVFEDQIEQDIVALEQAGKQRSRAFSDQCGALTETQKSDNETALASNSAADSSSCRKFAARFGDGVVTRIGRRILRYTDKALPRTDILLPFDEERPRIGMPTARVTRSLLELGTNLSFQPLEELRVDRTSKDPGLKAPTDRSTSADDIFDSIRRLILQVSPFVFFGLMGLLAYGYLCRALFGMNLFEFRSLHPRPEFREKDIESMRTVSAGGPPPLRLYINYPFDKLNQLKSTLEDMGGYNFVELARVEDAEAMLASVKARGQPWVVLGLMRVIRAPKLRRKALDFLERLVSIEGVQIHFFSEMLPIERLKQVRELERLSNPEGILQDGGEGFDESRHWALLLAKFVTIRWDSYWELTQLHDAMEDDKKEGGYGKWVNDLIRVEFEGIPNDLVRKQRESFLEKMENKADEEPGTKKRGYNPTLLYRAYSSDDQPLREQVIEYLANVISDYYQMIWSGSTREEQILMYHLASGRFVKTTDFRTINGLMNRDLVKRDPNLVLMNESFAFWVRTNEKPETFKAYQELVERTSSWSQFRLPVLVFVIVAAVALAYLDQGTIGSVLSLIPAIAAAIPVFASLSGQSRSTVAAR